MRSIASLPDTEAIINSGIQVCDRIPIPENQIPADAQVEIIAKKAAGYYTQNGVPDATMLAETQGRDLGD